jgi:hypothetical protein
MPRKDPKGFENVQRDKWYPGSPNAATAIRRGSKYGDQYAKEKQGSAGRITRGAAADRAEWGGPDAPMTAAGNKIARRGAASIAADTVVNDITAGARKDAVDKIMDRSKYAKK